MTSRNIGTVLAALLFAVELAVRASRLAAAEVLAGPRPGPERVP